MRRFMVMLAGLTIFMLGVFAAPPARADSSDDSITRYTVTADAATNGTTTVTLDFDFNFGRDSGHGPYITLPLRQGIADDPDHWRMLDVTPGAVTSPSGANAQVQTQTENGNLLIRVGNENRSYTGTQSYRITYTIRGLIAPQQATSGLDEFNWNVIGSGWEVPIRNITATVNGPVDVVRTACFAGGGLTAECTSAPTSGGTTATFTQRSVAPGEPVQIVAGFPAGTFVGAEARLEKRLTVGNMFPLTPVTGGIAAVITAVGLGALLRHTRRGARDEVYLGLTPGIVPAAGQEATIGRGAVHAPVAVQFTPPKGARPGEIGVLTDSTADNVDLTATIIDLAVRKHLRIDQQDKNDWSFVQLPGRDELNDYESHLLTKLFQHGSTVTTDDLKDRDYAGLLEGTRALLYQRVTTELHWFKGNPRMVRGLAVVGGLALVAIGAGLSFALGLVGFGLVGVAVVICGLATLALHKRFGARTADGSAMLAQAKGFELYLTTAEADQIKFEEGVDIFSRYLPYAIVFGVAERWAKVFEQLAAQGRYQADNSWYVGYGYGTFFNSGFISSLDQLGNTMSTSMQSATAATSGGSGFSGGGGFGGGGGGGW